MSAVFHYQRRCLWHSGSFLNILLKTSSTTSISSPSKSNVRKEFTCRALTWCDASFKRTSPDKFELAGKIELMTFVLTFLNSTWYIKNPFLKSKINDVSPNIHYFSRMQDWSMVGLVYEHMGLWTRADRHPGQPLEHSPDGAETPHAGVDAFLHRCVLLGLRRGFWLISARGGANGRNLSVLR